MTKFKKMDEFIDKKDLIKDVKVQFALFCRCGNKIMNDELVKKLDKYYCPKCSEEIISIGK